jgi:hypothetical protein
MKQLLIAAAILAALACIVVACMVTNLDAGLVYEQF